MSGPGNPAYPPSSVSIASSSASTPAPAPFQAQQGGQQPGGTASTRPGVAYQSAYPPVLIPQPPKTIGSYRPSIARPPISVGVPVQVPPPGSGPLQLSPEERDRLLARHTNARPAPAPLPTQFPGPPPTSAPKPKPAAARVPYTPRAPPPPVSVPAPALPPVQVPHAPPPPPPPPPYVPFPINQGRGPILAPAPPSEVPPPRPPPPAPAAFAPPLPPNPAPPHPHPQGAPLNNPVFVCAPALAPTPPGKRKQPDPPASPPPKKARPAEFEIDVTTLPDLPPYMTTKPDICKPVMANSSSNVPAEFSWSMKLLTLINVGQVDMWATQVEEIAKACGCHRELTNRFGVFPKPGTVEAFICETRYNTCWRILTETISGPVWAYMRALGYSKIPVFSGAEGASGSVQWQPAPVDCFYYAKQAGYRLLNPGSPNQSREEIMRMVEELRVSRPHDYPSLNHFSKGHHWLKEILDNLIRKGDRQVCMSLYDRPPSFAPTWTGPPRPEEYMWNLPGLPLSGATAMPHKNVDVRVVQPNQQALSEREQEWISIDAAQRAAAASQNGQHSVLPSNSGPPPMQPPPAHSNLPPQQPAPYHHPHQPPYPHPPPGPYMQQHPPPPMLPGQYNGPPPGPPGPGSPQSYVSPYPPPAGHPQQGPPPQGVPPQGGQPPQSRQGQPPSQQINQQQQHQHQQQPGPGPQQAPPPPQQNQVITIPDSPKSDPPTPPPLFTEEEDNADDDNYNGNSNNINGDNGDNANTSNNSSGGVGASAAATGNQTQDTSQQGGGGDNGGNDENEDEEDEEETFHDAQEAAGPSPSLADENGEGDGDVVMADHDDANADSVGAANNLEVSGEPGNGGGDEEDDNKLSEINEEESEEE